VSAVAATIDIAAAPEAVFDTMLDPRRLAEWVTIHRRLERADDGPPRPGFEMVQVLALRGAPFHVRWTLTDCRRPQRAIWEGSGPAHSHARTSYVLTALDGGLTRVDYENEFRAPGGLLGAMASRALMGEIPTREARRTLAKLKRLLESGNPPFTV
jgi:carbon monoxide dehydrogenase subunit G